MNILFLDSETNGKPINYKAHPTDVDNWPRCIQLAWQVANESGEVLREFSALVYPDNWTVPNEPFFIQHDLTTERCQGAGIKIETLLDFLIGDINRYNIQIVVAHNIAFDHPIVAAEMIRANRKTGRPLVKMCTMESGTNYCKIPFGNDRRPWMNKGKDYKWPSLQELHKKLFGKDFEGGHDAGNDVTACRLCFFEMVRLGVISLPLAVIQ